jgi:hypothetical protein
MPQKGVVRGHVPASWGPASARWRGTSLDARESIAIARQPPPAPSTGNDRRRSTRGCLSGWRSRSGSTPALYGARRCFSGGIFDNPSRRDELVVRTTVRDGAQRWTHSRSAGPQLAGSQSCTRISCEIFSAHASMSGHWRLSPACPPRALNSSRPHAGQ